MIEFYDKFTGEVIQGTDYSYFIMNNIVYRDNGAAYEAQCAVVLFEDFIEPMPKVGFRLKGGY